MGTTERCTHTTTISAIVHGILDGDFTFVHGYLVAHPPTNTADVSCEEMRTLFFASRFATAVLVKIGKKQLLMGMKVALALLHSDAPTFLLVTGRVPRELEFCVAG